MLKRYLALFLLLLAAPAFAQQQQLGPLPTTTAPTVSLPIFGVPASLTSDGSFTSQCINASYYRSFTAFAAIAGTGSLQVQRYADQPPHPGQPGGCTIPVGAAVPVTALSLTNGGICPGSTYCGTVASNDGMSFVSLKITLTDTSGATNAITSLSLLLGAE
jgi:hypothetical protein